MPRLFVAIDLPASHRDQLAALADPDLPARWTPPEQFHLTLRFVGEVTPSTATRVEEALAYIEAAPFDVTVSEVGVFPSIRRPRILYAGITHQPLLLDLQDQVEVQVRSIGLEADAKPFHPHVTLARLRHPKARAVRAFKHSRSPFELPAFRVDEFVLYESHLRPEGALHERRATYPLGAP